jgi:hypothetical protein
VIELHLLSLEVEKIRRVTKSNHSKTDLSDMISITNNIQVLYTSSMKITSQLFKKNQKKEKLLILRQLRMISSLKDGHL